MGSGGSESPIEVFVGEVGEPPLGPVASSGLFPFPLCFGGLGVLDQPLLSSEGWRSAASTSLSLLSGLSYPPLEVVFCPITLQQ